MMVTSAPAGTEIEVGAKNILLATTFMVIDFFVRLEDVLAVEMTFDVVVVVRVEVEVVVEVVVVLVVEVVVVVEEVADLQPIKAIRLITTTTSNNPWHAYNIFFIFTPLYSYYRSAKQVLLYIL
jgi:hypothetical protein